MLLSLTIVESFVAPDDHMGQIDVLTGEVISWSGGMVIGGGGGRCCGGGGGG